MNRQAEINIDAWKACDTFRGVVDPGEYKHYLLVLLFIKYLSDLWRDRLQQYRQEYKGDEARVQRRMSRERFILPEGCDLYTINSRRNEAGIGEIINFSLEKLEEANKAKLEGVFRNVDFNSESILGETRTRNGLLKQLIEFFVRLDLRSSSPSDSDVAGNTYQYLIERFTGDSGSKSNEIFTPPDVSTLIAELLKPKKGDRVCDPVCGSGSLLLRIAGEVPEVTLFGQERNAKMWALCRLNMYLHDKDTARIAHGDTLLNPKLIEEDRLMKFDIVVGCPPLSTGKWGADEAAADDFNRFHRGIPPKSKADYAFITHIIETMVEETGRAAVIVAHGALFRGGSEGEIRRKLIEENLLEAVIGLPANLFYGTSIPAALLIFNRGKKTSDVLFVDASHQFEEAKRRNRLSHRNIAKIVETYQSFQPIENYSYRASLEKIRLNEFNLSIPRYVAVFEGDKKDIHELQEEIEKLELELEKVSAEIDEHLRIRNKRK
jgi:type I restriction enzyme M protein